jgi:putative membrane protein
MSSEAPEPTHPRRAVQGEVVGLRRPGPPLLARLAISWLTNALVLAVVCLLPNVHVHSAGALIAAAAVFGVLNTILKPLLLLITFPLALLTLGIAWFFVAMLMLDLTDAIVSGFSIDGFWPLVLATVIVWLVNMVLDATPGPWQLSGRRGRINRALQRP